MNELILIMIVFGFTEIIMFIEKYSINKTESSLT